jgi:molybdopterin-containing oxidoreductase family membrane subunit
MTDSGSVALLKPIVEKKSGLILLGAALAGATAYWLYWCVRLLTEGHGILGTTSYGATWGLMVASIVHVIGISHVGIAISAAVRVLKLEPYRNVARLAELVTLIALVTAVIDIALDVGRPDRFLTQTILYGRWHAPMVWSMTVIFLYFLTSFAYLYLAMRRDFWRLSASDVRLKRVYRLLAFGYRGTPEERDRHDRTLFWLAIVLVPVMVSVHSVYGLIFGLVSSKAGWFNPLQAPYFVLGAIVSGFSAIIVIAALLRWAYSWHEVLTDRIFKTFGGFLAFVVFLYLYFMLSEQLTIRYLPLPAEKAVSDMLLLGEFSTAFWVMTIAGLVIPFAYLFVQSVRERPVSVLWTAAAALAINVALLWKRILIVVPAQYQAHLPLPRHFVPYVPTYPEVVLAIGSYAFAALVFLGLLKVIPVVELREDLRAGSSGSSTGCSRARRVVMLLSLAGGLSLIAWGLLTAGADFAPVKWLAGLALLVAIPLERCLIGGSPTERGANGGADALGEAAGR